MRLTCGAARPAEARTMKLILAVLGLLALASCGQTAVPLPAPVEGSLTGTYAGNSRITATSTIFNFVVYDRRADLEATITDAAGTLAGTATVTVQGEAPFTAGFSGNNAGGRVTASMSFQACEQTVELRLEGTVNPAGTINFGSTSREVSCQGNTGTVTLAAFRLVRD